MKNIIYYIYKLFEFFLEGIGKYSHFIFLFLKSIISWKRHANQIGPHIISIGIHSIPIVLITSLFSGMVTSIQAAYQFESGFVPNWFVGSIVGESVLLELAPMITALVMTGRIGATIAAEIGTMRVSEQIDALESLSFDLFLLAKIKNTNKKRSK